MLEIVKLLLIILFSTFMNSKMDKAFKTIEFIRLLIESTNTMNESIRLYIIIGDPYYLNIFKNTANARIGMFPWTNIADEEIGYNGPQSSIKDISKKTDLTYKELEILNNIYKIYNDLLWIQIEGFNIAQGRSDPKEKAKKEFDSMKNKTYIDFPVKDENAEKNKIENGKKALDFLNKSKYQEIYSKLINEYNILMSLVSSRINKDFKIYKYSSLLFYGAVTIGLCLYLFLQVQKLPNYDKGLMSIYNTFFIIIAITLAIYGYKLYLNGYNRINSYLISNIIQEIASNLISSVRDYTKTMNQDFFDRYWTIISIKNGNVPWSELSKTFKEWNILPNIAPNNELLMTYKELLIKANFNTDEIVLFNQADDENNNLIWKDIESFNWANLRWDKNDKGRQLFSQQNKKTFIQFSGNYDKQNSSTTSSSVRNNLNNDNQNSSTTSSDMNNLNNDIPNIHPSDPRQESVNNLYSNEYIISSNLIKQYTTDGENNVIKRTTNDLKRTRIIFYSMLLLFICIILFMMKKGAYVNIWWP